MYYSALRFICGDLNSGNGIVMQELEQLKGKEINMLRFWKRKLGLEDYVSSGTDFHI